MMPSLYILCLFCLGIAAHGETSNDLMTRLLMKLHGTVAKLSRKLYEVEAMVKKNSDDISSVQSETRSSVKRIKTKFQEDLGKITKSLGHLKTDVAFEVRLPSDMNSVPDQVAIKFPSVVYNQGDGFQSSTGIFTAPVSGTYLFWAHIMVNDGARLHVFINHNNKVLAQSHIPGGSRFDVPSVTAVAFINKGDHAWFSKSVASRFRGDNWSSYGGALIRAH